MATGTIVEEANADKVIGKDVGKEVGKEVKEVVKKVAKKTVKSKTDTVKKAMKTEVYIQFGDREIMEQEIISKVKGVWQAEKKKLSEIATLSVYVKPEEQKAYFVINDTFSGAVEL